jgi:hypothetical protein
MKSRIRVRQIRLEASAMKKAVIVFALALIFSATACAAKTEEKARDGWWWKMMMFSERTPFIDGYKAGMVGGAKAAATMYCHHGHKRIDSTDCIDEIAGEIKRFYKDKKDEDIEDGIDDFYSSVFTSNVDIGDAMIVVSMRLGGYGEFADCLQEALSEQIDTFKDMKLPECAKLPHPSFVDPMSMMTEDD